MTSITVKDIDIEKLNLMNKDEVILMIQTLRIIRLPIIKHSSLCFESKHKDIIKFSLEFAHGATFGKVKSEEEHDKEFINAGFTVDDVYKRVENENKESSANVTYIDKLNTSYIKKPKKGSRIMSQKISIPKLRTSKYIDVLNVRSDYLLLMNSKEKQWLMSIYDEICDNPELSKKYNFSVGIYVYKGTGSTKDIKSFRPIMMIPNIVKLFHKILYDRLSDYFINNKYINIEICKGGIKKTKSGVIDQVLKVRYSIEMAKQNKAKCCIIFIDISNAFGNINIKILCKILKKYFVEEKFISYVENYYSDFKYYFKGNTNKKKWITKIVELKNGLIQGCPLSMFLFNIYMNYILVFVESLYLEKYGFEYYPSLKLLLSSYVDDISITCKDVSAGKIFFKRISSIFAEFGLPINKAKSAYMAVNDKTEWNDIQKVEKWEYLGFMMRVNYSINRYFIEIEYSLGLKLEKILSLEIHDNEKLYIIDKKIVPYINRQLSFIPELADLHTKKIGDTLDEIYSKLKRVQKSTPSIIKHNSHIVSKMLKEMNINISENKSYDNTAVLYSSMKIISNNYEKI